MHTVSSVRGPRSRATAGQDGGILPDGLGLGLFDPNNPVQAGLALLAILVGATAIAFFTSLIVAALRARRGLQL